MYQCCYAKVSFICQKSFKTHGDVWIRQKLTWSMIIFIGEFPRVLLNIAHNKCDETKMRKFKCEIGDLKGDFYLKAFFTVRHTTWKCLLRDVRISPSLRNAFSSLATLQQLYLQKRTQFKMDQPFSPHNYQIGKNYYSVVYTLPCSD